MKNIYTFGPVNSRRFGLSLGIDLSASKKQCNFDCVYCELKGAKATPEQTDIAPLNDILDEIKIAIKKYPNIDVLTISANGEPTMYPYLKELINSINTLKLNKTKTLILSNASSITNKNIANILLDIDIVKLSLDSVEQKIFQKIDRPHPNIKINDIISAILEFKKIYKNQLVIEIMLVKNINDKPSHIKLLNETLLKINPSRIDISTIDRPPAYNVKALDNTELFKIVNSFDKSLNISIAYNKKTDIKTIDFSINDILDMTARRPQSQEDVETFFSKQAQENLEVLIKSDKITTKVINQKTFFIINKN